MDAKAETTERRPVRSRRIHLRDIGVNAPVDEDKRRFLKWFGLGAAVGLAIGTAKWGELCQFLESLGISEEERKALEKINRTLPDERLHNLVVGPDGAQLRKRPLAPTDPHDETNPSVGSLKAGTVVPEAITFPGLEPMLGSRVQADWYAIPTSIDPDGKVRRLAFSWSGNFQSS